MRIPQSEGFAGTTSANRRDSGPGESDTGKNRALGRPGTETRCTSDGREQASNIEHSAGEGEDG